MADITLKGNPVHTVGELPPIGKRAPAFKLVRQDLSDATLATFVGKRKILNIFPSLDTAVCALSVRTFTSRAASLRDTVVLHISADLPFAQKRFCAAEGIENAHTLSAFRSTFADDYGVRIIDGPLAGLCSRAVMILDIQDRVTHTWQVPEIAQEPDYDAVLEALQG